MRFLGSRQAPSTRQLVAILDAPQKLPERVSAPFHRTYTRKLSATQQNCTPLQVPFQSWVNVKHCSC